MKKMALLVGLLLLSGCAATPQGLRMVDLRNPDYFRGERTIPLTFPKIQMALFKHQRACGSGPEFVLDDRQTSYATITYMAPGLVAPGAGAPVGDSGTGTSGAGTSGRGALGADASGQGAPGVGQRGGGYERTIIADLTQYQPTMMAEDRTRAKVYSYYWDAAAKAGVEQLFAAISRPEACPGADQ